GMADSMHQAIKALGHRLRVYVPVGELVPGMAYLVRRLLENTSNESFLRHRFAEGKELRDLIRPPKVKDQDLPDAEPEAPVRPPTDPSNPAPFENEPPAELRRITPRARLAAAVGATPGLLGFEAPVLIGGKPVRTREEIVSVDPGAYATVVARSGRAGSPEIEAAVGAASAAGREWRALGFAGRAAVLFKAAALLRARKAELAALMVFEAGKPIKEADADVAEAIDFCEYYGREMLRLDGAAAELVQSPPGETNRLVYQGKGVTAVIAPWNFPLAIPTGMTVAALVAGNPVILKPAEQSPAVAWRLIEALVAGGAPPGVVQFLPGLGEVVGARLVEHPDVAVVAFTGSRPVGLAINQQAAVTPPAQRHVKRVIAEMGGKNALIIDDDADPDQAVPGAVVSAFGYAGQKCSAASRLVVVGSIYDQVVERVVGATRELVVGHPSRPEVQVGPVIDEEAHKRVLRWVEEAPQQGRILGQHADVPENGYFVAPTVVEVDDPDAPIAREEIFGPVLTVLRADDLGAAIEIANRSEYALTAGIFSRSPANIARAAAELRAGNVYINRHITGAIVGRQPFGGYGLSGVGSKAGGPDYLHQFLDPRVITENTLRQGFAPETA
ncbi:MAG TPA: proline dehydrogenase family protein, partial [Acidimicrobiales bacterium]|nr:proline dehydrogenase family protein [Acidimicrobiales bacterium]